MIKDIYDVRRELESAIRSRLAEAREGTRPPAGEDRVLVTVTPTNSLDVMVVSDLFNQCEDAQRDALLQSVLDALSNPEAERIDRWDLLTFKEAKSLYPSTLLAKSPTIEILHDLAASK